MNLDNFLESKLPTKKINLKLIIPIILTILIIIILTIILLTKKDNFEFKTISSTCNNFNLYGSIAYNNNKTSIYISNITYCGKDDQTKYQKIECTLYETDNKIQKEISKYDYQKSELITLEKFLERVNFKIDNYENICKIYLENTLHLEIEATDESNNITTYKIPLTLKDNC